MSALYDRIQQLADLLNDAGLRTFAEVPEKATPPFRYVIAAEPWASPGQTFGEWSLNLRVICKAARGTNVVMAQEAADLARDVAVAIEDAGAGLFVAEAIEGPAEMNQNGQTVLGVSVAVSTRLSRNEFRGA